MNRETFSLREQNILLRNKQRKADMMYSMNSQRRTIKPESSNSKKSVTADKKALEKTIDIKKVNNIKKQLKKRSKDKSDYLVKAKPKSIFTLNLEKKPSKIYQGRNYKKIRWICRN